MRVLRTLPSLTKIVFTDYTCMILFLAPLVFALMGGGLVITGRIDPAAVLSKLSIEQMGELGGVGVFLGVGVLALALCPPLLTMRVAKIRQIFRDGLEADAEVVFFRQFRDRGRIEFEFEHNDEVIRAANAVHLTRAVQAIGVGQSIAVVYLPERPKSAFIKEIFL